MATRLILPDYIVSHFVPPNACRRCGRSDMNIKLLFPKLRWGKTDIELVYPLRCPFGGSGCVPIKLPTLLFGYILSNVAMLDAGNRRRSKATMTLSPHIRSDMLKNMFRNFDRLMEADTTSTVRSPPVLSNSQTSLINNDAERIKFGFDKEEWKVFLRRLGIDSENTRSQDGE